jgi:LemA protein
MTGLIIFLGIFVLLIVWGIHIRNTIVRYFNATKRAWSEVANFERQKVKTLESLETTLSRYTEFEKSTLEAVIKARSEATSVKIDPTNMTPEQLAQFNQAQGNLNSSLSRLLVTVEQYPDLKANQNFLKLQDELASTENQILTARTRFNESVQKYNNYILVFPNSMFLGNYKEKPYFDAVAGAEKPVEVNFDFKNDKK